MESTKYQTEKGPIVQIGTEKNITPAGLRVANRPPAYQIPQTGLVAYWKFDEGSGSVISDSVGNLSFSNSTLSWGSGYIGSSIYMNNFGYANSTNNINIAGDISYVFWIKRGPTSWTDTQQVLFSTKITGWNTSQMMIGWASGGGGAPSNSLDKLGIANLTNGNWSGGQLNSVHTFTANQWTHIVVTRTGSNVQLYWNGILDSFISNFNSSAMGSIPFTLGAWYHPTVFTYGFKPYDTSIDELAIYNRVLSDSEILAIYNGQK
jgi:hypothetical protein